MAVALPPINPFATGLSSDAVLRLVGSLCIANLLPASNGVSLRVCAGGWSAAAVVSGLFGLLQYLGVEGAFAP